MDPFPFLVLVSYTVFWASSFRPDLEKYFARCCSMAIKPSVPRRKVMKVHLKPTSAYSVYCPRNLTVRWLILDRYMRIPSQRTCSPRQVCPGMPTSSRFPVASKHPLTDVLFLSSHISMLLDLRMSWSVNDIVTPPIHEDSYLYCY
jgi:hypothetical protein